MFDYKISYRCFYKHHLHRTSHICTYIGLLDTFSTFKSSIISFIFWKKKPIETLVVASQSKKDLYSCYSSKTEMKRKMLQMGTMNAIIIFHASSSSLYRKISIFISCIFLACAQQSDVSNFFVKSLWFCWMLENPQEFQWSEK